MHTAAMPLTSAENPATNGSGIQGQPDDTHPDQGQPDHSEPDQGQP